MAVYASTVAIDQDPGPERISKNLGILTGTIDVTNYSTTGAEITDITTKYFKNCLRVILDPMTDNGYFVRWDVTDKCVHAYRNPSWVVPHDSTQFTKATPALTYDSEPAATGEFGTLLYFLEGGVTSPYNIGTLQSTCTSNASVAGETDNTACFGGTPSSRFIVFDNNAPAGVQIYVRETGGTTADELTMISPTGRDGYFLMYTESSAAVPTHIWACAVKVHHYAGAAAGKLLYFDDNGAADAQFLFVDAGTSGGVIAPADIIPLGSLFGLTSDFDNGTVEVASDVDIGLVNFVAYGII